MNKSITKNRDLTIVAIILAGFFLQSCSVEKQVSGNIKQKLKHSAAFAQHHFGIAIYDLQEKKMIFEADANKYYTPASNTKLFTFYAALKMIPDSVPALRYIERGDSLIFWGTGDPSFLHTRLKGTAAFNFLKQSNKQIFFSPGRYTGNFYGNGWQWDDYNDDYQAEINELPLMDNLVRISGKDGTVDVFPWLFKDLLQADSSVNASPFKVIRNFNENIFKYPAGTLTGAYSQQVPYKVSLETTMGLLSDTLKKPVEIINRKMPGEAKTLYDLKTDSVLKEMLLPSDNFIAEQLLLACSDRLNAELNAGKAIEYVSKKYLSSLPDKPVWIDGSGLSRYNLFTPETIVKLLELIYAEVNDQGRLFNMLAAGGKTGTLKGVYPKNDHPFVFGKTGSFSNNYSQSGYIISKKGKVYIFSFMNNNFVEPAASIRKEVTEIVTFVHDKL